MLSFVASAREALRYRLAFWSLWALAGCAVGGNGSGSKDAESKSGEVGACEANANQAKDDKDNDGLSDEEERRLGTRPELPDSDGDKITDFGEKAIGTNPLDPDDTLPSRDFFVVLPHQGEAQTRTLKFTTNIKSADVYFLVDATGSMGDEIDNVRSTLSTIAAQAKAAIPDLQMGVGSFRDFPYASYGDEGDAPYAHQISVTDDLASVQQGLSSLYAGGGGDMAESQVEALYQAASGEGLTSNAGPTANIPAASCAAGMRGYPCFRPASTPVLVLVSDAPWHQGPANVYPYAGISPTPHTFDQAKDAMARIGARMVSAVVEGIGEARTHAEAMLRATGSVDAAGNPLVYEAPNGQVSQSIITGIQTLARETPQEVAAASVNGDNPGGFDARPFLISIVPREGYDKDGVPGRGYLAKDEQKFSGVSPDTQVEFTLTFRNTIKAHETRALIYKLRVDVVGPGGAQLDSRNAYVVVPPCGNTKFEAPAPLI